MSIDVQSSQPSLQLEPGATGRLKFTVTNVTQQPLSVVARIVPTEPAHATLLDAGHVVVDRPSRHLPAGGMDEFVVGLTLPRVIEPGAYPFVLRVASSASDAVQVWGESPQVAVTVPEGEKPPPKWPKWLMLAAALLVGAAIGALILQLTRSSSEWTRTTAIEEATLSPGTAKPIGVTDAGIQTLSVPAAGPVVDLAVVDGPLVALDDAGGGNEGERCTSALAAARAEGNFVAVAPIPIDGRALCAFIGRDQVGVIRILRLTQNEMSFTLDAWTVE
jgi:hypothetical protein